MDFILLEKQLKSLFENESDMIANMANMSAFVFQEIKDINWAGFYLARGDQLVLGPFQGKVACVRIPWGKGVCGTAAEKQETILVEDVHKFPGHIACDSASNSELVFPIIIKNKTIAVFDIDSPVFGRFTGEETTGIEKLVKVFIDKTTF